MRKREREGGSRERLCKSSLLRQAGWHGSAAPASMAWQASHVSELMQFDHARNLGAAKQVRFGKK